VEPSLGTFFAFRDAPRADYQAKGIQPHESSEISPRQNNRDNRIGSNTEKSVKTNGRTVFFDGFSGGNVVFYDNR
jgi:hypothetical protein